MKKTLAVVSIVMAIGSTACDTAKPLHVAGSQLVDLDARTRLVVWVEGVETKPSEPEPASVAKEGDPIHRVLQSGDGKVLFSYDLQVSRSGKGGAYNFLLKPAGKGPTFAATRDVTVKAGEDDVRVELMEQPGTGRKVEDVFKLVDTAGSSHDAHMAIGAHLQRVHQMIYRWVHGE